MTSTLILYFDNPSHRWTLQEERNFIIEDIEDYLEGFTTYKIDNFQYQKIALDMETKVPVGELYSLPLSKYAVRYASIIEGDNTYYFYVRDSEWISTSALRLVLHLDTLNTFKYGSDYEVSSETHITRHFKDRLISKSYSYGVACTYEGEASSTFNNASVILTNIYGDEEYEGITTIPIVSLSSNGTEIPIINGTISIDAYRITSTKSMITRIYSYRDNSELDSSPYEVCPNEGFTDESTYDSEGNPRYSYTAEFIGVYVFGIFIECKFTMIFNSMNTNNDEWEMLITFNNPQETGAEIVNALFYGDATDFTMSDGTICSSHFKSLFDSFSGRGGSVYTTTTSEGTITSHINSTRVYFETDSDYDIDTICTLTYYDRLGSLQSVQFITPSWNITKLDETKSLYYYEKIVDWYPEEINPPLYKRDEMEIIDSTNNFDWYLIVRNQLDPSSTETNPVIMDVCASVPLIYNIYEGDNLIDASLITNTIKASQILIAHRWSKKWKRALLSIKNANGEYLLTSLITDDTDQCYILVTPNDGKLDLAIVLHNGSSVISGTKFTLSLTVEYLQYEASNSIYYTTKEVDINLFMQYYQTASYLTNTINGTSVVPVKAGTSQTITNTYNIASINEIDRTDTRLIKIFKLPYIFFGDCIKAGTTEIYMPTTGELDEAFNDVKLIQISGGSLEGESLLASTITSTLYDPRLYDMTIDINTTFNPDALWSVDSDLSNSLEAKMLNSEFFYQKIVYDSFNYTIRLENLEIPQYVGNNPLVFDFQMSNTVNSNMMLSFDYTYKYTQEDYEKIMIVSRNNEVPLFNNAYIEYLNTGYNYDVKNKNLRVTESWINTGFELFSDTLTASHHVGTRRQLNSLASNAIPSFLQNMAGNIINQQIAENNINKRITESQYEPTSVYGSDDIDLLSTYSDNRAKIVRYSVSDEFRKLILAMFHYTGYKCNEYGVPNTHTRTRFDFIEAEIVFDSVLNFSSSIKNDIINKWGEGVYFIHHYRNEWDTTLKYENYEVSIVGEE